MCGRFSLTATPQEVQELFGLEEIEDFPPRYNIAPTQPILIIAGDVRREEGDNRTDRRRSWRAGVSCRAGSRIRRIFRC
jgi:putative SOS response-associated peptidase YedK